MLTEVLPKTTMSEKVDFAYKLREVILINLMDNPAPSHAGLSLIRNEVGKLLG